MKYFIAIMLGITVGTACQDLLGNATCYDKSKTCATVCNSIKEQSNNQVYDGHDDYQATLVAGATGAQAASFNGGWYIQKNGVPCIHFSVPACPMVNLNSCRQTE